MAKEKIYKIELHRDSNENNAKKEQFKIFQKDGVTVQVPIGKIVDVPEWVALRAKEIGLIEDYYEVK